VNKFEDKPYPDADSIESGSEAQQWATVMYKKNPEAILAATAQHMWGWAHEQGAEFAKADAELLQRYTKEHYKLAYSFAKDNGLTDSVVAGLCDVARAGFTRGYKKYEENNPLICKCCGQPLPPKEG